MIPLILSVPLKAQDTNSAPSKAFSDVEEYVSVSDSVMNENSRRQMDEFRVQYDNQQKENEIALLKVKEDHDRIRLLIFVFSLLLLSVLVVMLFILNRSMNAHNKALKQMESIKDRFYSVISHDLKSPAVAQEMALQSLCEDPVIKSNDELSEKCGVLVKTAKAQSELVHDLLLWTRLQTGNMQYVPATFKVVSMFREVSGLLAESLKNKEISLKSDIPDHISIYADRIMASIVMRNLMSNAVKFSRRGGTITVSAYADESGRTGISVADKGVGMSAERLETIFNLDKVESTDGTEGEKGSGIGLEVCKEMVEKCGGIILVESEEGKGSVFTFILPASPEAAKKRK